RPSGDRPQGQRQPYQGNRPQGSYTPRDGQQNRPPGDRPQGQRPPYQGQGGNRPPYQGQGGQRPYQGQGGQRPQGGYTPRDGQQRPQGDRPQGNRPPYQGQGGQRPQGQGGQRPQGQGGAPRTGAKPAATTVQQKPTNKRFDKDKDISKRQNKQESMFADATAVKQGPRMKKLSKKEMRKQKQVEKELEEARIKEEQDAIGITVITIGKNITVKELADKLGKPTAEIIKPLMKIGIMANINQEIDFYTASNIASGFDVLVEEADEIDILEEAFSEDEADDESAMAERPPVVVVMGHVDHGKTSLLDSIRQSRVTATEAGGITQHIGAYTVEINNKPITFLDTPGHEAFTAMRMRGAQVTDIAILVVAADDGVMPQTIEAINHAKAANVEIIVAINKIDKPSANPDRVKQELTEYGILTEDWGGETICVPVSALQKTGIDQLLEMILLAAEMRELKANPKKRAKGTVIESQLDKGRGPVATVLVQEGTLYVGDPIVVGGAHGRIRAMINDKGEKVKKAGPSMPVEVLGLNEVPMAGDVFYIADNERQARQVAESVVAQGREDMIKSTPQKVSLDDLFSQIQAGNVKDLNIVIKADVAGSVEAVKNSLERLSNEEVRIRTIHGGVGAITESDVMLASASNAIIIGFNVRPESAAQSVAAQEKVDVRLYRVIYNAIEDITAAMKGMLDPEFVEKVTGHAEIRQIFKASGIGNIAGSYITDGKITRNSKVRLIRDGAIIFEGELAALKRFKDDVKEVNAGYECGLTFTNFNDIKEGDKVEAYVMEEVAR
ncbi:translation initiation factor IF-2, partial [Tyzzerella sp. OttesenSCG-928-J15]|nr:translation initiation factor IF-2 [Tyzzerella sp. OttesenSCG-928-J15]